MPSPFKEAVKKQVDDKRRLSVTIVLQGGRPILRWQCWWSKGQDGKTHGGRSAYALSRVTKVSQREINELLGLVYDEEVEKAETAMDKVVAILGQPARDAEARRVFHEQQQAQILTAVPHLIPSTLLSLWDGNPLTVGPEQMVEERGITKDIGYQYGLAWDYDCQSVLMPWIDQSNVVRLYQWWNGTKYRFPRDEPGKMTKSDAVFGLHLWKPGRPLLACEGGFTAMSVCGCGLGGSVPSDIQLDLLAGTGAEMIVVAFDNDHGGFDGAVGTCKRLKTRGRKPVPVFCPDGNDWNNFLVKHGFQGTMQTLAERIQNSLSMSFTAAIATQYRGKR